MPDFLEYLRQKNIFNPTVYGNDLPEQGGITGTMFPGVSDMMQRIGMPPQATPLPQPIGATGEVTPMGEAPPFDVSGMFGGKQNPWDVSFGKTSITPGDIQAAQQAMGEGDYDAAARLKELYQPSTEASQRFNEMLGQYPEATKPGWLSVIGATLADLNRPGTGMSVIEGPRARKLADWKNRIEPTQQAANLERQENVNARTLAYQTISAELRDRAQDAKNKNDEVNARIRQQRADVYEFKARNPNMKILLPKGGNIQAINPITGEVHDLGIPTGSMTELDKINLQQEQALEKIGATGAEARATERERQTGREAVAETRGWKVGDIEDPDNPGKKISVQYNEITGEIRPIKLGGKQVGPVAKPSAGGGRAGETPQAQRVREFNAARKLKASSPALSKYITLGTPGANDFDIMKPGKNAIGGRTGPTPDEYRLMIKEIYGQPQAAHEPTGGAQTTPTTPPQAPAGWKYVAKPGGGWTAVPDKDTGF